MLAQSNFIFNLIDEFEIFSSSGDPNSWTDDDLDLFSKKYKDHASKRDEALFKYLNSSPKFFRCHLPYSKWTLGVALNVVWYYDELIITDPILSLINNPRGHKENQKSQLQDSLKFLLEFKESITGGYILFAGDLLVPNKTGNFEADSDLLLTDASVLQNFENYTLIAKKPSPINDDVNDNLTQLLVEYEGMWGENKSMGMYIPKHVFNSPDKLKDGIMYDLMSPFTYAKKEELVAMGKQDMLVAMQKEYSKDITIVLEAITNAQRLDTPVLFYRDVDCHVAKRYAWLNSNPNTQLVNTTIYDFTAPYLKDIPPERLFETRTQVPQAFNDFRYFLSELVTKTMKATNDPVEIKYKIDHEIASMLNKLDVEIKSAERKLRVHGIAAPIIAAIGSLGLISSGIDYSKLYSILLGTSGGIKSLTTWFDVNTEKDKAALNPVYFMWKAQSNNVKR